jgi:RNA polymerase sigma-70 factor (ECF subfamily)
MDNNMEYHVTIVDNETGEVITDINTKGIMYAALVETERGKRIAEMRLFVDETSECAISDENPSPEMLFLQKEEIDTVHLAVNGLPEKQKLVLLLFYMENLSTAQIAAILNIPQGTVLSRLHQARKRLQHELEALLHE